MSKVGIGLWLCLSGSCATSGPCDAAQPEPAATLDFDFEGDREWPGSAEAVDATALAVTSDEARLGVASARMVVSRGESVAGGTRSELSWDNGDLAGAEVFYAWSLFLPADWPDIDRVSDSEGRPNWQIVGQWHDQPNRACGEDWEGFPSNSPSLSIQYLFLSASDPEVQEAMARNPGAVVGLDASALDRPLLGLSVGVPPELRAVAPIEKGRWIDLQMRIVWSRGSGGEAELTLDGVSLARFDGPNMWNDVSHYFKIGLYRNPSIVPNQLLYVDEILVTRDAAQAAAHDAVLALTR